MKWTYRSPRSVMLVGMTVLGLVLAPAVALLMPGLLSAQSAETIFAITNQNRLVQFSSDAPDAATARAVTGLQMNETLQGIDFRPATNQLFAVGSTNRVYTIDPASGAATMVGTQPFTTTSQGTTFGFDFNPAVDRIRLVSDTRRNLRLTPITGAVAFVDAQLTFAMGDPNAGQTPQVVGAAYTNNVAATTTTSLYVIDAGQDVLALQGSLNSAPVSPNAGQLFTVGALGVDATTLTGFDIAQQSGTAFASFITPGLLPPPIGTTTSDLYTINLTTGAATDIGTISPLNTGEQVTGLAVQTTAPPPTATTTATATGTGVPATPTATTPPTVTSTVVPAPRQTIYGLTTLNRLLRFNSDAPGTILSEAPITGLQTGDLLVGIDFRPANGSLFALSSGSRLYTIDPNTGVATLLGTQTLSPTLQGMAFGFDFNPMVDRIRVVSDAGQNLRLNPNNAAVVDGDMNTPGTQPDGQLAYADGSSPAPQIVGAGYTNNISATMATQLFVIDAGRDALARQGGFPNASGTAVSPNSGQLQTVGSLGIDANELTGFDVAETTGVAYAAVTASDGFASDLATINLASGQVTRIGTIGGGGRVLGLTVMTTPPQNPAPTATPGTRPGRTLYLPLIAKE